MLGPARFRLGRTDAPSDQRQSEDGIIGIEWEGRTFGFEAEFKPFATPKLISQAVVQATTRARQTGRHPLVIVPYLAEERLRELEAQKVSGIDLCGNGVIIVPGQLLVYRTGAPNRFPPPTKIKNAFAGVSSLVSRTLILARKWSSAGALQAEIERRGGDVALSTLYKILASLDEELLIAREGGRGGTIRLLQPDVLLDRLVEGYRPPEPKRRLQGKVELSSEALLQMLVERAGQCRVRLIATGTASTLWYATAAREPAISVYCSDVSRLVEGLPIRETSRFANLELIETQDAPVYYDPHCRGGFPWASAVQTYVELARGDKRELETAAQVRKLLLEASERRVV